jgi:hypothetical protein
LTIQQLRSANRFAKWTKIVAPVFWHNDLAGEQLWFQEVWGRAWDCLLWHSTQNGISPQKGGKAGQDKEVPVSSALATGVISAPTGDHIVQNNKKVISAAATFGSRPMAMAE